MDPGDPRLTGIIRRVLMKAGLPLDPYTVLELATMLQPLLRDSSNPYAWRSAVDVLEPVVRKMGVDDPREAASRVLRGVLREIGL